MNNGLYAFDGGASATAIAAACANRFDGPGTNASKVYRSGKVSIARGDSRTTTSSTGAPDGSLGRAVSDTSRAVTDPPVACLTDVSIRSVRLRANQAYTQSACT